MGKLSMGVLCVDKKGVRPEFLSGIHAVSVPLDEIISKEKICWKERPAVEQDFSVLQIIPYVLIRNAEGKFATYMRHGSEKRIHGLFSCGIGGHVEESDQSDSLPATLVFGMMREVSEELGEHCLTLDRFEYKGILIEDETKVGRTHLALLYLVSLKPEDIISPDEELANFSWCEKEEVLNKPHELWTELALNFAESGATRNE